MAVQYGVVVVLGKQDEPCAPASHFDMDKVKSTLKQFVRDWSSEGQKERDSCYLPVIEEIQRRFPSSEA